MSNILIVEDEADLRFSLQHNLQSEGYEVTEAGNGLEGLAAFKEQEPDLVILDVMMPKMDGLTVLKEIRKVNVQVPVMMLTARTTEMDKVIGLELGADDYLTKPFSLGEFLARVKALLRRAEHNRPKEVTYEFGFFKLDLSNRTLLKRGKEVHVSQKEYELLMYFLQNPNTALSKKQILQEVWGYEEQVSTRTIDTHVARLRRKLDDQDKKHWIQTVPTLGYRFNNHKN